MKNTLDKTPVNIKVNNVKGVAIQPFEKPSEELLEMANGHKRIMMIDLAATEAMQETIKELEKQGSEVVSYRDHHYSPDSNNPRDKETVLNAEKIKEELGSRAQFKTRESAPSCINLVELGEATRDKVDLILHHGDADGFMTYLKASGVHYEGMESDADILDSRGDTSKLTEHAQLYKDALVSVPAFNRSRPDISNKAKQELEEEFANYIQSEFSEESAKPLKEKALSAAEQEKTTNELIEEIDVVHDVFAMVNTTFIGDKKFDIKRLSDAMEKNSDIKINMIVKNFGPLARDGKNQISISRSKNAGDMDLRDFIPEGIESGIENGIIFNTPFLVHIQEGDLFRKFFSNASSILNKEENEK